MHPHPPQTLLMPWFPAPRKRDKGKTKPPPAKKPKAKAGPRPPEKPKVVAAKQVREQRRGGGSGLGPSLLLQ